MEKEEQLFRKRIQERQKTLTPAISRFATDFLTLAEQTVFQNMSKGCRR